MPCARASSAAFKRVGRQQHRSGRRRERRSAIVSQAALHGRAAATGVTPAGLPNPPRRRGRFVKPPFRLAGGCRTLRAPCPVRGSARPALLRARPVGFGVENVAFGHYVVARAAPWPADPLASSTWSPTSPAPCSSPAAAPSCAGRWAREAALEAAVLILGWSLCLHWPKAIARRHVQRRLDQRAQGGRAGGRRRARRAPAPRTAEARWLAGAARRSRRTPCAPFFLLAGIQHILFVQFVETLVPPFIPFGRFWTYFAAAALLAAGFGLLAPPVRRLAATLTGWMVFSWVFLVHVPLIFRLGAARVAGRLRSPRRSAASASCWLRSRIGATEAVELTPLLERQVRAGLRRMSRTGGLRRMVAAMPGHVRARSSGSDGEAATAPSRSATSSLDPANATLQARRRPRRR